MPGNVRYGAYTRSQKPPHATPTRAMSLDSLHDRSPMQPNLDARINDYLPTRVPRTQPKVNKEAMKFVQTGPAGLAKVACEQIKKTEKEKEKRKNQVAEEAEWQQNLDKWKSSRRKRNEVALERVIEVKKNEQDDEMSKMRRKSKTFSEMREDKDKRGRKYKLVVHDDDNNDMSSFGLSMSKSTSSLNDTHDEGDGKDLDHDNKDAKSDAGFCTGSDTGSDGVFAEDNISDTSSALGDKKETHDSLLDSGVSKEEEPHINGHSSGLITEVFSATPTAVHTDEYTYDKAIAGYKQYAENSAKKRTSSITSLNSNTSFTKDDDRDRKDEKARINGHSSSPNKSSKLEEKLNFFSKEMEKENRTSPEPRVTMREKSPKVDISKRRSLFETSDVSPSRSERDQKQANRRSLDVSSTLKNKVASFENLETDTPRLRSKSPAIETNLRSKVASFENLDTEPNKVRGITPTRDTKFQEKRAAFTNTDSDTLRIRKNTPERDVNFHKKLKSFTSIESGEEEKVRERKTIPQRDLSLKNKIASFEQLEQAADQEMPSRRDDMLKNKDRSVSLERLDETQAKEVKIRPARSMMNILRRTPSTPYMVVDLEGSRLEEQCVVQARPVVSYEPDSTSVREAAANRSTIYESVEKCQVVRDVDSAPIYSIFQYLSPEVDGEDHREIHEEFDDHQYQTLEEVREEVQAKTESPVQLPLPPAPLPVEPIFEPPVLDTPEVLDVTWTDGPSQVAPPSEPPPPPPPDDDSDTDASDQPQSLPAQDEDAFNRENSTRRLKKELWRRRSDFLGTSSQYIEEETVVKPPPDLSDLLRQERKVERSVLESQQSKTPTQEILSEAEIARREREIIENLERSEQLKQQQHRPLYTWEDRMREDKGGSVDKNETDEHLQYQEAQILQQPSSELDRELEMSGVTSTNIPESSLSVSATTSHEHNEPTHSDINTSCSTVLNSTINTEKRHAEVLESHLFRAETFETEAPQTEGQLSDQYLVSPGQTLDTSFSSVASSSQPQEYKELAELEMEMMRHDKHVLRRIGQVPVDHTPVSSTQTSSIPPPTLYASQEELPTPLQQLPSNAESGGYNFQQAPSSRLPIQEFYTAPTYESSSSASVVSSEGITSYRSQEQKVTTLPSGSPSQYSALASPHPYSRSNSQSSIETPKHPPLQGVRSTPLSSPRDSIPEPLPRKKKVPPPTPTKSQKSVELDTAERQEALRLSRMSASDSLRSSGEQLDGTATSPSGQQMSKQTLLALSAIPKPKLTENESWIKKKPEMMKRDYSKHWLHQEAEQRRLEQQDRISRQNFSAAQPQQISPPQTISPQQTPSHTTSYLHSQSKPSYTPQSTTPAYSSYPQALKNPSPSHSCSNISTSNNSIISNNNNNSSNSWRNQATTYQPHIPTPTPNGDKALPDSIIHNLTQRVNNKNNKNTYNSGSGRLNNNYGSSNYTDDNFHDYMNADALSSPAGHAPLYQGPNQPSPPNTQQQDSSPTQDQRLLSVSGKKKCSHCSEELGRGAAMIIESLRLFYHIPCFKCCVCGIQLGNGSAGADVRVRNHKLHCHNCYSNDEGMKFSKV